ncbi:hypothetical protein HKD37_03G007641 [Glycine soja]
MSSFLFDSAIGLGGSNFEGSIQQPLMDQEVIFNGGPSSENTRYGAFDSESSSSGRLRASHHIGGRHLLHHTKWVRDDVLNYMSSLTSATTVAALQCQVKLKSPEDSCKIVVHACGNDDFPFLRAASGSFPFFFMYRCVFEVMGLFFPLKIFQYALLEHVNVASSQLHPNSWAMMKLMSKIGWVSLNNVSKKLFEFDSNIFHRFKDHFFKVLGTGVMADGFPLMFNKDGESRFPFYW